MVGVCLAFKETIKLFQGGCIISCFHQQFMRVPFTLHSCQHLFSSCLFGYSHSNRCEVLSYHGFDSYFPNDQCAYLLFIQTVLGQTCFAHVFIIIIIFFIIEGSLRYSGYKPFIRYVIFKYCQLFCGFSFDSLDSVFCRVDIKNLIKSDLSVCCFME